VSPVEKRCVAPLDDDGDRLCGEPATEDREVDGLLMPLCWQHAHELDEERSCEL
jgi:hypothetical protein